MVILFYEESDKLLRHIKLSLNSCLVLRMLHIDRVEPQ